jgi:hypothetical protein
MAALASLSLGMAGIETFPGVLNLATGASIFLFIAVQFPHGFLYIKMVGV